MKKNPLNYRRKSIRLKGYDYTKAGAYFITLCAQDMRHFFGKVYEAEMQLNAAGQMVEKWWLKIPEKFPDIALDVFVVMPNHFHAIVINTGKIIVPENPGVDFNFGGVGQTRGLEDGSGNHNEFRQTRGSEDGSGNLEGTRQTRGSAGNMGDIFGENPESGQTRGLEDFSGNVAGNRQTRGSAGPDGEIFGEHGGSPLFRIIQWFKTMSTNEYIRGVKNLGWDRFNQKLWQKNYYERIIWDDRAFQNISHYILNNPAKWGMKKVKGKKS